MNKFVEICRFCLENDGNLENIFIDTSNDYANKVILLTDTEVAEFPMACFNCIRLLEIAWKFRLQAQHSIKFLKKYYHFLPETNEYNTAKNNNNVENRDSTDVIDPVTTARNKYIAVVTINKTDNLIEEELESVNVEDEDDIRSEFEQNTIEDHQPKDIESTLEPSQTSSVEFADESSNEENIDYCQSPKDQTMHTEYVTNIDIPCTSDFGVVDFTSNIDPIEMYTPTPSHPKRYFCNECDRVFTQAGNLYTHKLTHSGIREHCCDKCQKTFKYASHLKTHLYTHNNPEDRRFACSNCNAKFNKHSYLKTHQRQHTGERPYKCDCGKSFNNLSNYKSHLRIHTGEKNYACNVCSKRFTQSSCLLRHKKSCTKKIEDSNNA